MLDLWKLFGLGTTFILSNYTLIIFFYFLNRIIQSKKPIKEILPFLGISFLYFFAGISYIFAAFFDFYHWQYEIDVLIYLRVHFILFISSQASCIFVYEYIIKKTRYFFTIYILIGLVITFFMLNLESLNLFFNCLVGSVLPILIIFQYQIFVKPTSGLLKNRMKITLIGLIVVGSGSLFRNYFINEMFGYFLFSIGTSIVIIGILLIGYGFSAFTTLTDLQWKEKLYQIYVISQKGICLYAYSFENKNQIVNTELIASSLSGIQNLLAEIFKTKEPLKVIEYRNSKILINFKHDIAFLLFIREDSNYLLYILEDFSEKFLDFFKESLKDWQGNTEIFTPTKSLIQSIFELNF